MPRSSRLAASSRLRDSCSSRRIDHRFAEYRETHIGVLDGAHKEITGPQAQGRHHAIRLHHVAEHDGGDLYIHLAQRSAGLSPGHSLEVQLTENHVEITVGAQGVFGVVDVGDDLGMESAGPYEVCELLRAGGVIIDDEDIAG